MKKKDDSQANLTETVTLIFKKKTLPTAATISILNHFNVSPPKFFSTFLSYWQE